MRRDPASSAGFESAKRSKTRPDEFVVRDMTALPSAGFAGAIDSGGEGLGGGRRGPLPPSSAGSARIIREQGATLTPTLSLSEGEGAVPIPSPAEGERDRVRGSVGRGTRLRELTELGRIIRARTAANIARRFLSRASSLAG